MRHAYAAQLHLPDLFFVSSSCGRFSAPDEILVGLDVDPNRKHIDEVESAFEGQEHVSNLFGGQGYVIKEAHVVNRGDSYSVHHLPENGPMISFQDNAVLGQAGSHWLHTHPNAPAIPSGADTDLHRNYRRRHDSWFAIFTRRTTPWFDDVDGTRRSLGTEHAPKTKRSGFPERNCLFLALHQQGIPSTTST